MVLTSHALQYRACDGRTYKYAQTAYAKRDTRSGPDSANLANLCDASRG